MTSPTTPRDAIGLIERLRRPLMDSEGYFVQPSKRDLEAAAALDALQARVKELEASNRAEWNRRREAESQRDVAKAAADTLRQQRDEAYERAVQAIRRAPSLDENGYIVTKDAAIKAIRRLAAGDEKEGK